MLRKAINSVRIGIVTWTTAWVGEAFRFPIQNYHVWAIYGISVGVIAWVWLREEKRDIMQQIWERKNVYVSEGDQKLYPTYRDGSEGN